MQGMCGEYFTPYILCTRGESGFGDDGHSYFSRAFFIMFKDEKVDLNEVVQFFLYVNLPSNVTPSSSIMHCKLFINLLHEKQHPSVAQGKGDTATDGDSFLDLNVVSTAIYSLRVPAEGIHEMIPITFSSPYFVCLEGMIHCTLLGLKPSLEGKYIKDLGKEREIQNRRTTIPSSPLKPNDCSEDHHLDESGVKYNMIHIEMMIESLNSIVLALQWLLDLEPIRQENKEYAFIHGSKANGSAYNEIANLLKRMNSNSRFSSLIHYLERRGISHFIKHDSSSFSELSSSLEELQNTEECTVNGLSSDASSAANVTSTTNELKEEEPPQPSCLPIEENLEKSMNLISEACFVEWNLFFVLLPLRHEPIVENLRCAWLFQCRQSCTSIALRHTSDVKTPLGQTSCRTIIECDLELYEAKLWRKLRRELNIDKGVKDGNGLDKFKKIVRLPEHGCPPMFLCQRYISSPQDASNANNNNLPKLKSSTSLLLDGMEKSCSLGSFFRSFRSPPPPRPHLIVFQHGYCGTARDMNLLSNWIQIFVPKAHVFCPKANEGKLNVSLEEMGSYLADEVVGYIKYYCPDIAAGRGGLSFVGFSAGSLVIRCMLRSEKLRPFHHCFHLFLSLSSPHLGVSTLSGDSFLTSAAIWGLRKWRKEPILDELTLADASSPKDTLLYRLSESPHLSLFRNVRYSIVLHTPD